MILRYDLVSSSPALLVDQQKVQQAVSAYNSDQFEDANNCTLYRLEMKLNKNPTTLRSCLLGHRLHHAGHCGCVSAAGAQNACVRQILFCVLCCHAISLSQILSDKLNLWCRYPSHATCVDHGMSGLSTLWLGAMALFSCSAPGAKYIIRWWII